jgi:hypothetical protein
VAALTYYHDPDEIVLALDDPTVNVRWFGAVGDDSDNTAAFKLVRDAVKAAYRTNPEYAGAKIANIEVFIPAGDYLITEAEALMDDSFTTVVENVKFVGAGYGATQIIYDPAVSGPLFYNNNAHMNFGFENIRFTGKDSGSDLLYSNSDGQAKSAKFIHCQFSGTWRYGVHLVGTNTNSEYSFDNCRWDGDWTAFLYSPETGASNQFLNYWFNNPIYWSNTSPMVDMKVGGHVHVVGGDFSGFQPTAATYLFKLGSTASAAFGVQTFEMYGCRFELINDNARFMYCEWDTGAITLVGCDFSSQALNKANTSTLAQFYHNNNEGPEIGFYNCQLIGVIEFIYGISNAHKSQRILFENCNFIELGSYDAAFAFTAYGGHNNLGGKPVVRLRNCRIHEGENVAADADINWQTNVGATTSKKVFSMKYSTGSLPAAVDPVVDAYLPLNAVITDIRLLVPAGDVTQTSAATFTVQTTEAVPTVLFTVTIANFSAGSDTHNAQFTVLDTADKAHIQLIADANVGQLLSDKSYCLVEYIG